jgi:hypothetical protein
MQWIDPHASGQKALSFHRNTHHIGVGLSPPGRSVGIRRNSQIGIAPNPLLGDWAPATSPSHPTITLSATRPHGAWSYSSL